MAIRLFRQYVSLPILGLLVLELIVLSLSLKAAVLLVLGNPPQLTGSTAVWVRALLFSATTLACFVAVGLYSTRLRVGPFGIIVRLLVALMAGLMITALWFYLFPETFLGRGVVVATGALSLAATGLTRVLFYALADENLFRRRVLVLGAGQRVMSILKLRRRADQRGFRIVGYVPTVGDMISVDDDRLILDHGTLLQLAKGSQVDEIVVAQDDRRKEFPLQELLDCRLAGIDVTDLMSFLERETGKVQLDVMNPSWFIFAEGFKRNDYTDIVKRGFDLVAAAGLLLLTLPALICIYLAIKLTEGFSKPAFFQQRRVGLNGEVFTIWKFRSMTVDAEEDGRPQWAKQGDARVTPLGAVLRKTRLDELPQLWNVLKGEMSFVGPRPERPEFVSHFNEVVPYYRERHCVKPGITGWAQMCYPYGSSEHDAMEKLKFDMYYVKNRGLLFDLAILLQTVEVVFWGKGAR